MVLWVTKDSFTTLPTHLPEMIPSLDGLVWSGIVNMAEEVKNPKKTLPRAIIIALITTTVLYIVVALACILTMPIEELSSSDAPLADIYAQATSGSAHVIVVISLAKLTSFITLVVFALINLALWVIKGNEKFEASHFSIPRVLPLIGFIVSSGFIVLLIINILI